MKFSKIDTYRTVRTAAGFFHLYRTPTSTRKYLLAFSFSKYESVVCSIINLTSSRTGDLGDANIVINLDRDSTPMRHFISGPLPLADP